MSTALPIPSISGTRNTRTPGSWGICLSRKGADEGGGGGFCAWSSEARHSMAGTRSRRISSPMGGIGSAWEKSVHRKCGASLDEGGASALVGDHRQTSGEAERDSARHSATAFDRPSNRFGAGIDHLDQSGTVAGDDADIYSRAVGRHGQPEGAADTVRCPRRNGRLHHVLHQVQHIDRSGTSFIGDEQLIAIV